MTQSLTQKQLDQLQECFALAVNPTQRDTAKAAFAQLSAEVTTDPAAAELLEALWTEVLSARRSEAFWQQMSDAEKGLSDRVSADHINLQQNHMRLIQEQ
jgi:gamma-glutamylcysteine synthetase